MRAGEIGRRIGRSVRFAIETAAPYATAIFIVVSVAIALTAREKSPSFATCISEHQANYAGQTEIEGLSHIFGSLFRRIVAVRCTGVFIAKNDGVITALATAVIALLTWVLWKANQDQLRHTKDIERAYISGGGPTDEQDRSIFILTVNNYGKTPGILTGYAVGFCPRAAIPAGVIFNAIPKASFHDRIPPVAGLTRGLDSARIPDDIPDPLIYGRFWFDDIWGDSHESGFVLVLDAYRQTTPRGIPLNIPPAYTYWY